MCRWAAGVGWGSGTGAALVGGYRGNVRLAPHGRKQGVLGLTPFGWLQAGPWGVSFSLWENMVTLALPKWLISSGQSGEKTSSVQSYGCLVRCRPLTEYQHHQNSNL